MVPFEKLRLRIMKEFGALIFLGCLAAGAVFLARGFVVLSAAYALVSAAALCNFLAISKNSGKMPDAFLAEEESCYRPVTRETHFPFLADRIIVGDFYYSIGDILAFAGLMTVLLDCLFGVS